MGSHAKNNGQQSSTPAATPTGAGGPTTSAKMTPYLQKHPVGTAPISGFVPGVSDAGPKLPGMAAGFDSHGNPLPVAQPQQGRNTLAGMMAAQYGPNAELSRMDRLNFMMGSRGSRGGGASQGDRQGATTSGRDNWGGSSGGRGWW